MIELLRTNPCIQIKQAAKQLGIGYENARAIVYTFRRESRISKVPYEIRKMHRRNNKA